MRNDHTDGVSQSLLLTPYIHLAGSARVLSRTRYTPVGVEIAMPDSVDVNRNVLPSLQMNK